MKLSIIIPLKNQSEKLIRNLVEKGLPAFDAMGVTYEVVIVPNACDEPEIEKLESAKKGLPLQVKILEPLFEGGKGRAVRHGFINSTGDYVMFMDADFATDLEAMKRAIPLLKGCDCLIGSRNAKGSVIPKKQPLVRRILHSGSRFIIRNRFGLRELTDTQCGFKFFSRKAADLLVEHQTIMGAAFDVEYLYFLKLNGFQIKEMPVIWTDDPDSSFKHPIKAALSFYKELGKIKKNKKNYVIEKEEETDADR